MMWM